MCKLVLQEQSLDSMVRFACGGADKALLAEREFMAVMHLIYVAHREQLPGSGPGSPASSAGSSMTSPRDRRFTCVLCSCSACSVSLVAKRHRCTLLTPCG